MRNPKSILITGGSSGMGEALALVYAAPDVHLALTGRDAARLEDVAQRCRAKGAGTTTGVLDVRDAAAMREWIEREDDKTPFDLVIANAGTSDADGERDFERHLRQVYATNVEGVFNTVLPALDRMRARRRGQVAIMSSLASFRGMPGRVAYSSSKAALRAYGEGLRGEVAAEGIEVSVICPGYVRRRLQAQRRYPMPFLMDVERAAKVIRRGLARNAQRIAFPFPAHFFMWLAAAMPAVIGDRMIRLIPRRG